VATRTNQWFSGRAILAHVALLIWFPGCLVACWWQATRAMSGNWLSWLYATEWPALAVFGVAVWWGLLHDDPDSVGTRAVRRWQEEERRSHPAPERRAVQVDDPELAAYNRYLASLAASGRRKSWRSP